VALVRLGVGNGAAKGEGERDTYRSTSAVTINAVTPAPAT